MNRTDLSADKIESLIDLAYAVAECAETWETFLAALADASGSRGAVLLQHDTLANGITQAAVRVDPEAPRLYDAHFHRSDPRATSPVARAAPVGSVIPDEVFAPYDQVRKTAFHNDWSTKFDVSRLIATTLSRTRSETAFLSVLRAHRDTPFGREEVRFLEVLAPHLRRALRLRRIVSATQEARQSLVDGLDVLALGILILDESMQILHANAAARTMLHQRDGLIDDRGELRAARGEDTTALRALCLSCGVRGRVAAAPFVGAVRVVRPSGRDAFQVVGSQVRQGGPLQIGRRSAFAVLIVSDPADLPSSSGALLRAMFGLTASETAVAVELSKGSSANEVAETLAYTRETARWYIKQVLAKTSCRSRTEFVHKVSALLRQVRR